MPDGFAPRTPVESHHPGPPRFVSVGEPIRDPAFVLRADDTGLDISAEVDPHDHGRDNLAPRLPSLRATPDNYDPDDFEWSVRDAPDTSSGDVLSFATATTPIPRYDAGEDIVAEFEADAPGRYILSLDAPDGTHELTVHAFPEPGEGDRPRIELAGTIEDEEFLIDPNAALAPGSDASPADIDVTFLADDRDALDTEAIVTGEDGLAATVPLSALDGESARIHAAAYDGKRASVQDVIELHPDGSVSTPNRPPEWIENAVIYEIFPRSWAGEPGATTFETLTEGDADTGARGVEYLAELGVDAVWLTPVVPAMSAGLRGIPGGPHGYGTLDYFAIAPDLAPEGCDDPITAYESFVGACHEHDIRVLFDLVISHAGRNIDLFQDTIAREGGSPDVGLMNLPTVEAWDENARTFDWWDRVDVPRYAEDGTRLEVTPRPTGFGDGRWMPNFNYEALALREYMLAVADFWARAVGVDGFRCDVAHGVPQSFWMEVRELVRDTDAEFLMIDETLPNDPVYSQSQFGAHFDTHGFTYATQEVAAGEAHPEKLVEAVTDRPDQGHPDFSRILNAVENHDEHRLLNRTAVDVTDPDRESVTESEWDRAAARQRAAFAASVTLPGVPMVYYGQERAISRYGEGRHGGEDDDRGIRDGEIFPQSDVRPGGRQRAFLNWDEYDAAHLQFYRELINSYKGIDALGPAAELESLSTDGGVEAVAFYRDASELADVSGPERVLVVVNFESSAVSVAAPSTVGRTNLVADDPSDRTADGGEDGERVVDTVGVFSVETTHEGIELSLAE